MLLLEKIKNKIVVYFDQQTGLSMISQNKISCFYIFSSFKQQKKARDTFVSSGNEMEGEEGGSWTWANRRQRKWSAGSTGNPFLMQKREKMKKN